jgi:NAD(P)H-nitrite reductase large subunit
MNQMADYIIVGSGAAGVSAAGAIRKRDPQGNIFVFTNDPYVYYSRPGLAYLLAGEVPHNQLFPLTKEYFQGLKIQIVKQPVQSISTSQHLVHSGNGKHFRYDRLLLATGATASMPKVQGIELDGVVKLDTMEDTESIIKNTRRAQSAVVIGGGITALELAEGLAACGVKVHYFLRGDRYWSSVLDETESKIVEKHLFKDGIQIHYFTELVELIGKNGKVKGVVAKENGSNVEIACQIVAFAIGIKPRIDLAVRAGLKTQRGILVDTGMRTSQTDVFAAGDVAQVYDHQSGEYLVDSLWRPSIEQGWVAGLNMAGENFSYVKKNPFNVTRLGGLITTIIGRVGKEVPEERKSGGDADVLGIMRGDSEIWRKQSIGIVAQTYQEDNRIRLYVGAHGLTGAVVMGDQALSRPLQYLIRERVDISSIRDILLKPDISLVDTLTNFWEEYNHNHAK